MFDIKEVIGLLCKHLSDTVDSSLTPEHFRLAKYDKTSDELTTAFWSTLDKLSFLALKELDCESSFSDFDICMRTKLRLAFLQYPFMEIYFSSDENNSSQALLFALSWLITKFNILKNVIRFKVVNSSLGREFSTVTTDNTKETDDVKLITVRHQVNNLLHKTIQMSQNLKAITELQAEKGKLTTKVHAASITTSGLPHLSVSEMSLIKKIATEKDNKEIQVMIEKKIKEMKTIARMLDTQVKWTKKSHIFHTWMGTVLDEYEKAEKPILIEESLQELAKFIYLLRYIIKRKLKSLKNKSTLMNSNFPPDCPTRLLRVQECITGAQMCLTKKRNYLDSVNEISQKMRSALEMELRSVLNTIPDCICI